MRVTELGEGVPEVAVVGGIHGDEPCGPTAIERFLAGDPDLERPVKFVVANEEALAAGVRYLDEDLNRAFPGSPDADTHEGQLAHRLASELRGSTVLSLHSTQSYAEPFALCDTVDEVIRGVVPHLPVDVLIETAQFTDGRLIEHAHTVEVECGLQGSEEATDNGYWLIRAFLTATGALSAPGAEEPVRTGAGNGEGIRVYRLEEKLPKPPAERYEVFARNFSRVQAGEPFAVADGSESVAQRDFYPVLLSAYGYEDVFGYAATKIGTLG
ncbi:succinylglutamate desuccinylase/aspartoacylase [Halalkaliarchaeum desulfuricum]|uniref:Succinylglutamate desuccinylase/aspartoacylase n=1 Tax=Halalkaliarchaeum desulfuricum TaxID=2055893 RepID=A0A343THG0_9EURY|nr:succinylglutamate desuccinylase/aspartoacylase family protein [Halalkaliarchaeum desulfuricum]AUX08532.1 succinylglutamate desuccinylase/aspartoacylase [Halalkaliarchaeum desulfuricum]